MLKTPLKTSCSSWLPCYTYGPFTPEGREAEELNLYAQTFSTASTKTEGFLHTDNLQMAIFSRQDGKRRGQATQFLPQGPEEVLNLCSVRSTMSYTT